MIRDIIRDADTIGLSILVRVMLGGPLSLVAGFVAWIFGWWFQGARVGTDSFFIVQGAATGLAAGAVAAFFWWNMETPRRISMDIRSRCRRHWDSVPDCRDAVRRDRHLQHADRAEPQVRRDSEGRPDIHDDILIGHRVQRGGGHAGHIQDGLAARDMRMVVSSQSSEDRKAALAS